MSPDEDQPSVHGVEFTPGPTEPAEPEDSNRTPPATAQEPDQSNNEILDAANNEPAKVLDLISKGANLYAISDDGRCLLQLLVVNRDITEDIFAKVLDYMKESPNEAGNEAKRKALIDALGLECTGLANLLLQNGAVITQSLTNEHWPLCDAAWAGNKDIVLLLLKHGAKVNEVNDKGFSPLDNACRLGYTEIVNILLDHNADINITDNNGWTPLATAARFGQAEAVSALLAGTKVNSAGQEGYKEKADINKADNEGCTPLDTASRHGHAGIVKYLLENGAEVNKIDNEGWTALKTASRYDYAGIVKHLLEKGADINKADNQGCTPLDVASQHGHAGIVKYLLENGAEVNKIDNDGWTALKTASHYGHAGIVKYLLENGADINKADNDGWAPLKAASRYGHAEIVKHLLEKGADINKADNDGWTALISASKWGYHSIAEELLKRQANPNLADDEGWTALHRAAYYGHAGVVGLLLEHKARRDAKKNDGCTALHLASQQGYEEVVQVLLEHQAPVDVNDAEGWTALHKASFHNNEDVEMLDYKDYLIPESYTKLLSNHRKVVQLLLTHKADAGKSTNDGYLPLHLAAKRMNTKCLESLLPEMKEADIVRTDGDGHTPLYLACALEPRDANTIRVVLSNMKTANFGIKNIERDILLWAAGDRDTHDIVAMIAQKGKCLTRKEIASPFSKSALCWAACNADLELVRQLLYSSALDSNGYKERKLADTAISQLLAKERRQDSHDGGYTTDPKANITKDGDRKAKRDGEKLRQGRPKSAEAYKAILDLLHNPPIVPTTVSSEPCTMPVLGQGINVDAFEAAVVDFYTNDHFSGFLRRLRGVKEVIYDADQGPEKLMASARKTMLDEQRTLQDESGRSGTSHAFSIEDGDFKFRWIHLPANNMQWMNDLLSRVYLEKSAEDRDRIYGDSNKFFRRSWHQVPDRSSQFRFMKPGYLTQNEAVDGDARQLALYMPYLTFAMYPAKPSSDYEDLLRTYSGNAIHGFRTLDESYYQFNSPQANDERERRNGDQVVTRIIYKTPLSRDTPRALVGVEQLWLWVIDSKTIITSSTHRVDDEANLAWVSVLDKLSELRNGENRHSQPSTPWELSRFIVDTCARLYEDNRCSLVHNPKSDAFAPTWSIQQFFSHAVNKAAMVEAELFDQFTKNGLTLSRKQHHKTGWLKSKRDEYIGRTAELLCQVKDLRDELNILKAIVGDQAKVQQKLSAQEFSAAHIIEDLDEMDKTTERIYEAVNSTLSFEQNVIALAQSDEAVQQGRVMVAFTVATIIFLPMSFLVSLFAVDITVFQHDPSSGNLQYTPGWIFPIIFGVSAAVWVPLILITFRSSAFRSDPPPKTLLTTIPNDVVTKIGRLGRVLEDRVIKNKKTGDKDQLPERHLWQMRKRRKTDVEAQKGLVTNNVLTKESQ